MIGAFLWLTAAGIGLTQAVSDPGQVTLRWLRLGGLIAAALLAVGAAAAWMTGLPWDAASVASVLAAAALVVAQLMAVQVGWRRVQRALAVLVFIALGAAAVVSLAHLGAAANPEPDEDSHLPLLAQLVVTAPLSAGLLGGFLMTMLLGHAYLTAGGEMTQRPFLRLVGLLASLLLLRAATSVGFGLVPWWGMHEWSSWARQSTLVMVIARYAVGLVAPAVFVAMTWDCVRRRANQSATGILYVAGVMVIVGEGIALALVGMTGRTF